MHEQVEKDNRNSLLISVYFDVKFYIFGSVLPNALRYLHFTLILLIQATTVLGTSSKWQFTFHFDSINTE